MEYRRGPGPYWRDHWPAVAIGVIGLMVSTDPETPYWIAVVMTIASLFVIAAVVACGVGIWIIDRRIQDQEDQDEG